MRIGRMLLTICAVGTLGACAMGGGSKEPPLYGNYENVDDHSLCLGMMAYAADFPATVWPNRSKEFYDSKREEIGLQSAALYKITVNKFGKKDAAERGVTGYSSARTLAYVLGPDAVKNAVNRCEPVVAEALKVDAGFQKFVNSIGQGPANPVVPDVVPTRVAAPAPTPVVATQPVPVPAVIHPTAVTENTPQLPNRVPAGFRVMSTPRGDYLVKDDTATDTTAVTPTITPTPVFTPAVVNEATTPAQPVSTKVPEGYRVLSTPRGDFLIKDGSVSDAESTDMAPIVRDASTTDLNRRVLDGEEFRAEQTIPVANEFTPTGADDLNAQWRQKNMSQ